MDAECIKNMFVGVHPIWREIIGKDMRPELTAVLLKLDAEKFITTAAPEPKLIFNAFRLCEAPRVVLIGQDPYTSREAAQGLSFSVPIGRPIQPSLRAIYASMVKQGVLAELPKSGDLTGWAEQGVLLLNMALTTTIGKSGAHMNIWKPFINRLISIIIEKFPTVCFVLLGEQAQKLPVGAAKVFKWGHPSPLNPYNGTDNPRNFIYNTIFADINKMFPDAPIDWARGLFPVSDVHKCTIGDAGKFTTGLPGWMTEASLTKMVWLFTDGGATQNGRIGCRASYSFVVYTGGVKKHAKSGLVESAPSNNRGELTGIYMGLAYIAAECAAADGCVIVSDSEYSLKCVFNWYDKWAAKGLLSERKNIDLIAECVRLKNEILKLMPLYVHHVRGHQDKPVAGPREIFLWDGNDSADKLCTAALMSGK